MGASVGTLNVLLSGVLSIIFAQAPSNVLVQNSGELRQALQKAQPGTNILLAPGDYSGGIYVQNVQGTPERPIVIAALDPAQPSRLNGGTEALHFAEAAYVELRDLIISGQTGNGLNIDDGGTFETPAHHITLRRLHISDVGPTGNRDGLKLSGVDDFLVQDCVIERWGDGGSGIDMVGCHRGRIEGCVFRGRPGDGGSNAVQTKGGSSDIVVRRNRFEHAGARAINIGGSTGLQFFRPRVEGYEAKNILVEGNVFIGAQASIAFVGVDGAIVRFNTIYLPGRWALRILQETVGATFVPCRNGVFTDNIIVFRSDQWAEGGCNIGPNTAPQTFQFARNVWYCLDRPERSRPTLPTEEQGGLYGVDPQFVNAAEGDFRLREGSPATGRGHTALPTRPTP